MEQNLYCYTARLVQCRTYQHIHIHTLGLENKTHCFKNVKCFLISNENTFCSQKENQTSSFNSFKNIFAGVEEFLCLFKAPGEIKNGFMCSCSYWSYRLQQEEWELKQMVQLGVKTHKENKNSVMRKYYKKITDETCSNQFSRICFFPATGKQLFPYHHDY